MRLLVPWATLLVGAGACNIDFVAVHDPERVGVAVRSAHVDSLVAHVEVVRRGESEGVAVTVEGRKVPGEANGPVVTHAIDLAADSLDPVIAVSLDSPSTGTDMDLRLPVMARRGSARCTAAGDVLLPVALGTGSPPMEQMTWSVRLLDSSGRPGTTIDSRDVPLPVPLVISRSLVSPDVTDAEVVAGASARVEDATYPLGILLALRAVLPLPGSCAPQAG